MRIKRLPIDREFWVILDFLMGITYMFFVNFYARVSHAAILDTLLSILVAVSFALFLGIAFAAVLTRRKERVFILTYIALLLTVYGLGQFIFPENSTLLKESFRNFVLNILRLTVPLYLINDYTRLSKWLCRYSLLISAFLLYQFFIGSQVYNSGRYSMALGYITLFPTMILISAYLRERKIICLAGGIINVIIILSYASRGPLLCLGLFLCLSLLRNARPYKIVLALLLVVLLYVFRDQIILGILTLIPNVQSSRTMRYLIENKVGDDSGRMVLYQKILSELSRKPLSIRGIHSDYLILGVYTHNIVLELLYEFGLFFGGLMVAALAYKTVVTYLNSKKDIYWQTSFLFMTIAIPELMVSHTLWGEWTFWAWLVIYQKCYGGVTLKRLMSRGGAVPHRSEPLFLPDKK